MDATELKRRLIKARARKQGRYPSALRDAVVEYATQAKQRGLSHSRVAAELGMCLQTLAYWRAMARRRGSLTPVAIVAAPSPDREIVVEFGPLRVRGLDVGGLAELFKRLT